MKIIIINISPKLIKGNIILSISSFPNNIVKIIINVLNRNKDILVLFKKVFFINR